MKVKIQTYNGEFSGYKVNENTFFPKENCELIKRWISEGNIPESEFAEEELEEQLQEQANAEARAKLGSLDWKVIRELERLMLTGTDLNLAREELRASIV